MKKYKNTTLSFLVFNTVSIVATFIFMSLFLYFYFNADPFPERFFIYDMTDVMIEQGQDKSLILILSFGFTFVFVGILDLISSYLLICHFFLKLNFMNELFLEKKKIWLAIILRFLFVLCYLALNVFLIFYFWYIYYHALSPAIPSLGFVKIVQAPKLKVLNRFLVFGSIISLPVITISTLSIYGNSPIKVTLTNNDKKEIKEHLTLSNNNPNTLILFFDRQKGVIFNLLLMADYLYYKDKSLIAQFPEFTSYTNVLSTNFNTIYSVPAIFGGNMFSPFLKNLEIINPNIPSNYLNTKLYKDMSYEDWYLSAITTFFNMTEHYGFKDQSSSNISWIGDDADDFKNALEQKTDEDLKILSNKKIAKHLGFQRKKKETKIMDDFYVLDHLDENLCFNSTNQGIIRYFSFECTHDPYVYKDENNNYVSSIGINSLPISIWNVIQTLKDIFNVLKSQDYYDSYGNVVFDQHGKKLSVYDQTTIMVLADHGFEKMSDYPSWMEVVAYLKNKNILSDEQVEYINQNKNLYYSWNPSLMIKPFLYNQDKTTNYDPNKKFFDDTRTISLIDVATILENIYKKYYGIDNQWTFFWNDNYQIKDKAIESLLKDQYVKDVLTSNTNQIKINNQRQLILTDPKYWKYFKDRNKFQFRQILKYDGSKGFWNKDAITRIK